MVCEFALTHDQAVAARSGARVACGPRAYKVLIKRYTGGTYIIYAHCGRARLRTGPRARRAKHDPAENGSVVSIPILSQFTILEIKEADKDVLEFT